MRPAKPHLRDEVAAFAKYAAIWLAVSLAVTALVWTSQTYGGLVPPGDPAGYFPWATPGAAG